MPVKLKCRCTRVVTLADGGTAYANVMAPA